MPELFNLGLEYASPLVLDDPESIAAARYLDRHARSNEMFWLSLADAPSRVREYRDAAATYLEFCRRYSSSRSCRGEAFRSAYDGMFDALVIYNLRNLQAACGLFKILDIPNSPYEEETRVAAYYVWLNEPQGSPESDWELGKRRLVMSKLFPEWFEYAKKSAESLGFAAA